MKRFRPVVLLLTSFTTLSLSAPLAGQSGTSAASQPADPNEDADAP